MIISIHLVVVHLRQKIDQEQSFKMGVEYDGQCGKAFKAKIKITEKEMIDYLEQFNCDKELIEVAFCKCHGSEEEYVI